MTRSRMIRARGDGITIQAADWPAADSAGPAGRTLLCVHGLTANCRSYDVIARAVSGRHRVVAVDLRGRGLSDKPPTGYSMDHHCRDLAAVLADLKVGRAVVMGHSLGAYISLALAAARPDLVEGLILLDGGADLSPEQWAKVGAAIQPAVDRLGQVFPDFEAYLAKLKQAPFLTPWTEDMTAYYRYEAEDLPADQGGGARSRTDPAHIMEERQNLARLDIQALYPKVGCPALIIRAEEGMLSPDDLVLPEPDAADLAQALGGARVISLAGLNHFTMVFGQSPARDQAILDFLAGL